MTRKSNLDGPRTDCILMALLVLIARAGGSVRIPIEEGRRVMHDYVLVWSGDKVKMEAILSVSHRSGKRLKGFETVQL